MWIVVEFDEDKAIAAVPNSWFHKGHCAWPIKSIKKNIERRTKPNELEFSNYTAKILFGHIGKFFL